MYHKTVRAGEKMLYFYIDREWYHDHCKRISLHWLEFSRWQIWKLNISVTVSWKFVIWRLQSLTFAIEYHRYECFTPRPCLHCQGQTFSCYAFAIKKRSAFSGYSPIHGVTLVCFTENQLKWYILAASI